MFNKALKITTGGLIILGGYISAYQYGYVRGVLACKKVINEPYQKKSDRPKRGYSEYYRRSTKPRDEKYILSSEDEAKEVLEGLRDILNNYGLASVADYKDLVGVAGTVDDNMQGWTDLSGAEVVGSFHGWTVVLPEPTKLN